MKIIIFLIIAVVVIVVTIYFSLKNKLRCPNCKSERIERTGNKKYEEDPPIAIYGSPDSYYGLEYKCSDCGHLFWEKQKAVIFN